MAIKFMLIVVNMPEDVIEFEFYTVISINYLLVYESKYYLHVYLNNCPYRFVGKRMIDYLFC